jgi:hypothetical protein
MTPESDRALLNGIGSRRPADVVLDQPFRTPRTPIPTSAADRALADHPRNRPQMRRSVLLLRGRAARLPRRVLHLATSGSPTGSSARALFLAETRVRPRDRSGTDYGCKRTTLDSDQPSPPAPLMSHSGVMLPVDREACWRKEDPRIAKADVRCRPRRTSTSRKPAVTPFRAPREHSGPRFGMLG